MKKIGYVLSTVSEESGVVHHFPPTIGLEEAEAIIDGLNNEEMIERMRDQDHSVRVHTESASWYFTPVWA